MKKIASFLIIIIFLLIWIAFSLDKQEVVVTKLNGNSGPGSGYPVDKMVALGNNDRYVAVWESGMVWFPRYGNILMGGIFDKKGNLSGKYFQISPVGNSDQLIGSSSVAMDDRGNFIIAWDSGEYLMDWTNKRHDIDIYSQRFDKNGKESGGIFKVNTLKRRVNQYPTIASNKEGDFVIAWESPGSAKEGSGIYARLYKKNGEAIGPEFSVTETYSNNSKRPSVAMNDHGNFIVVWEDENQKKDDFDIYLKAYDKNRKALSKRILVNTNSQNDQMSPSTAIGVNGAIVVVWEECHKNRTNCEIYGRRFNKTGGPLDNAEFKVNTNTINNQRHPSVAADDNGNYVVVWESNHHSEKDYDIYAQRYNKKGRPLGGEIFVNNNSAENNQQYPSITIDSTGDFIIAWKSFIRNNKNRRDYLANLNDYSDIYAGLYKY